MATEKNCFDDYLKEKLWRDIVFRMLVLIAITGATLLFAARTMGFSALAYLEKTGQTVGPVLNTVGLGALFLAACALMFKDLEHQSPNWSQETKLGKAGAFIRRLASDLMLWMLGIFGTLLGITILATVDVWQKKGISIIESLQLSYIYGVFVIGILVTACFNVLIRRPDPPLANFEPWASLVNSPFRTIIFYLGGITAITTFALVAS